jgi:hypothetical protein
MKDKNSNKIKSSTQYSAKQIPSNQKNSTQGFSPWQSKEKF